MIERCFWTALLLAFLTPSRLVAQTRSEWEDSPYKIEVWLTSDVPEFEPRFLDELRQFVTERTDVVCGATWSIRFVAPTPLIQHWMRDDMQGLTPAALVESDAELYERKMDKVLLLSVQGDAVAYQIG